MSNKDKLIIFDTTLRDGEQCPGASMNKAEKVEIAKALEALRVDVIEAGFPICSQGDSEGVQAVAKNVRESIICALSRARDKDIEAAAQALQHAKRKRIHTFIATSPVHMQYKLKMSEDEVFDAAKKAVCLARQLTDDVEFTTEDAGRSEIDFLCRVIEMAIDNGASTINLPDTVGYTLPHEYGAMVSALLSKIPNADKAVFSCHCHNDLGLAVANSLSAIRSGIRQVECTINGIGERAGNASLEEIVMAVRTRRDQFGCDSGIDSTKLVGCSKLVSRITGFIVQPNKAIVGANAFAHEAGIHQDGILKRRETYEIMRAQDVGWDTNRLVLGKHSGRNAFRVHLNELGIALRDDEEINQLFERFKHFVDHHDKSEVTDKELLALVNRYRHERRHKDDD